MLLAVIALYCVALCCIVLCCIALLVCLCWGLCLCTFKKIISLISVTWLHTWIVLKCDGHCLKNDCKSNVSFVFNSSVDMLVNHFGHQIRATVAIEEEDYVHTLLTCHAHNSKAMYTLQFYTVLPSLHSTPQYICTWHHRYGSVIYKRLIKKYFWM